MTETQGMKTERLPDSGASRETGGDAPPPDRDSTPGDPHVTGYFAPLAGATSSAEGTVLLQPPEPVFAWLVEPGAPPGSQLRRLSAGETTIGRDPANDIVLRDRAVSARHARLVAGRERDAEDRRLFTIVDLQSANGLRVNGEPTARHTLANNDEITIGQTTLIFKQL